MLYICDFTNYWSGCNNEADTATGVCDEHKELKCCVCGKQSKISCSFNELCLATSCFDHHEAHIDWHKKEKERQDSREDFVSMKMFEATQDIQREAEEEFDKLHPKEEHPKV